MAEEKHYTIGELADAAGVTPRTIRYYATEGLLPPPDTRGRYALYSEEHLLRLRLIARLKEAFLPLGEIKARLDQLSANQMRQLLAENRQETKQPVAESAADYVAQLLNNRIATVPPAPAPYQEGIPQNGATFLPGASAPKDELQLREAPLSPPAPTPLQVGRAELLSLPKPATSGSSLLSRLVPRRRGRNEITTTPTALPDKQEERWQRVTLVPGVELHIREPLPPALRERITRLIVQARELFENEAE